MTIIVSLNVHLIIQKLSVMVLRYASTIITKIASVEIKPNTISMVDVLTPEIARTIYYIYLMN